MYCYDKKVINTFLFKYLHAVIGAHEKIMFLPCFRLLMHMALALSLHVTPFSDTEICL